MNETHEMQLLFTEGDNEMWYCPTCGRKFIMTWPPHYKKIILEPGDETAIHTGGKGGLTMGAPKVASGEDWGWLGEWEARL